MALKAFKKDDNNPKFWMIDTTVTLPDGRRFHLKKRGYLRKSDAVDDFENQVNLAYQRFGFIKIKENSKVIIESFLKYKKSRIRLSSYTSVKGLMRFLQGYFYKNAVNDIYSNIYLDKIRSDILSLELSRSRKNKLINLFKEISLFAYNNDFLNEEHLKRTRLIMIPAPGFDTKKVHHIWSPAQYKKFISTFDDNNKYKVLFQFLFFTGVRIGEALALTWEDIDFENKLVSINKSATSKVGIGKALITQTKTQAGTRFILLSDEMTAQLLKLAQTFNNGANTYVFFGGKKPLGNTTVRRHFDTHTELANLPRITIHEIRHSNNTWLINMNPTADKINIISARLGRSSLKTTLDDYYHSNPLNEKFIVDKLEIE